jgi:Alpha-kinase family
VLTQHMDEVTEESKVKANLQAEYKLLAYCDKFKKEFDAFADAENVDIPGLYPALSYFHSTQYMLFLAFYFNYEDSILGVLNPSVSSNSCIVPHKHFLATPLLPCGPFDGEVRKFTGNDEIGEANDDLTQAIHAFVHFSLSYSSNYMLFCDLQGSSFFSCESLTAHKYMSLGKMDKNGTYCLFDPQCHM